MKKSKAKITRIVGPLELGKSTHGTCVEHPHAGKRGFDIGDSIRTSVVVAISEDGKSFETLNTVYEIV